MYPLPRPRAPHSLPQGPVYNLFDHAHGEKYSSRRAKGHFNETEFFLYKP